jgi:hypothetical protein
MRSKMSLFSTLVASICFLAACQQTTLTVTPLQNQEPTVQPPAATAVSGMTLDELMNAKVMAPQAQKEVQLQNGKYAGGSGTDALSVELLSQSVLGDLNNDGKNDAAVLLAENTGGTGVFVSLIGFLATDNGFTQSSAVLIDDRPVINAVTIADGIVTVDAVIHGVNDPMVSPTLKVLESYQLTGSALTLVGLSETSAGAEQKIVIDLPEQNSSVSGNIEVKGSMPQAPFENNLRYRFYDETGKVLNEGSFLVESEDVGKPATFDISLTAPASTSGSKVRLELAYLSAKDGSPVCLASVNLVVK